MTGFVTKEIGDWIYDSILDPFSYSVFVGITPASRGTPVSLFFEFSLSKIVEKNNSSTKRGSSPNAFSHSTYPPHHLPVLRRDLRPSAESALGHPGHLPGDRHRFLPFSLGLDRAGSGRVLLLGGLAGAEPAWVSNSLPPEILFFP